MTKQSPKTCYGILDHVFPIGKAGLREVTSECFRCSEGPRCLREALSTKEGLEMRAALLERRGRGGLVGRLQRWSAKKELSRLDRMKTKGGPARWR
jgi:hypothetical protein